MPGVVLKKPAAVASVTTTMKPHAESATVSRATISFADPTEKSVAVNKVNDSDFTCPQRSVLL